MKKRLSLLLLVSLIAVFGNARADVKEDEIREYINRQTENAYNDYVNAKGRVYDPQWEEVLDALFTKLTVNSGEKEFRFSVTIVNDPNFNAICFGGGQFVVNSGALAFFDNIINNRKDRATLNLQHERELLMAPVGAHELGHYYNRHYYKMLKKFMELEKSKNGNFTLEQLQYSIANEYEADYTGWLLLKKAGYNPELMAVLLEMLNQKQQDEMKDAASISFNQYFITHPSPHKRLARINNEKQEYHKIAAEMEQVFDDVQIGINLERSVDFLDKAIKKNPGNLYLKKERAVALHKLWLTTVPLSDQRIRGILDAPSFRDEMLSKKDTERSRGASVPGNEEYFKNAMAAYKSIIGDVEDYGFASNYSLLLIYSPDAGDKRMALQIAVDCAKKGNTIPLYSNCAVVMYMFGEKDTALNLIGRVAGYYDSRYQAIIEKSQTNSDYMAFIQEMQKNLSVAEKLNRSYVLDDFTPLLNYSLMASYSGYADYAKTAAEKYLNDYESQSQWAEYVSRLTGVKIPPAPEKKYVAYQGIKVKDNIQNVLDKWGKADRIYTVEQGEERWYYDKKAVSLSISSGVIYMIILESPDSGKIDNGIGIGSSRLQIEKIAGKHKSVKSGYYIYEGPQNIAIIYSKDIARAIILYP